MAAKVHRLNLATTGKDRIVPDTNRVSPGQCANPHKWEWNGRCPVTNRDSATWSLRVLVGREPQLEPRLTGRIVSRVYFQKAVENFASVLDIVRHEIGSRKVEVSRV
jgi:hypothetical protein